MKTVNLMGETQREQWHTVVMMIRRTGQAMHPRALSGLCDELDRYIDKAEDVFDEIRKEEEEDECEEVESE